MKKGGGKGKGSTFERKVCGILSLWLSNGVRDDLLWRSAISGGRATVAEKAGKKLAHVSGDICAVHPEGYPLVEAFFIECKHYRKLGFEALLFRSGGELWKFWQVALRKAKQQGKLPMMVVRQNGLPILFVVNDKGRVNLGLSADLAVFNVPGCDLHFYTQGAFTHYAQLNPNKRPSLNKRST
jgi:hypothetical protein